MYKVPEKQEGNGLHVSQQARKDVRIRGAFLKNEFTTQWKGKDSSGRGNSRCKERGTDRAPRRETAGYGQRIWYMWHNGRRIRESKLVHTIKDPKYYVSIWTWSSRIWVQSDQICTQKQIMPTKIKLKPKNQTTFDLTLLKKRNKKIYIYKFFRRIW